MAEKSILWATGGAGDSASAYTQDEITRMFRALMGPSANQGVFYGVDNALAVSGAASPVQVATGAALVYGLYYYNDTAKTLSIPTPSTGTTGHRVVLRANWTAKTVRITLISSADGTATLPSLTQSAGVTWDAPLAGLTITTGGVITLTDERVYLHPGTEAASAMLPAAGVHGEAVLNRLLYMPRRQGGASTSWNAGGTTNYTPGRIKIQTGAVSVSGAVGVTVTFPQAFTYNPLVFCVASVNANGIMVGNISTTAFTAYSITNSFFTGTVYWVAIGAG